MFALVAVTLLMQEPRVVPNRIECSRCTIQLVPAVTLGGNPDDLIEWPQAVSEDRLGRYFVTQPNKKELPVVFDASGRRLAVLGAAGQGPGEFVRAAIIAVDPRTDTIFVTDWITSRLSIFSPQLKFVRSFPFPGGALALGVLHDRHLVTMGKISDRASIGLPFHIFRQDGQRTRAIGDQRRPYTQEREMFFPHKLVPSRRDGFWAVPLWGEYRIEHWTTSGVRDAYLVRRPAWHLVLEPGVGRAPNPQEMETPPSSNVGVSETESGLLWVVTRVADSNRKRAVMDTLRNFEGKYVIARDLDQMWDSVIELIDPIRGVVVAAQRFDQFFFLVLPSGKVVSAKETDAGIQVRVFSLRLSRGQ